MIVWVNKRFLRKGINGMALWPLILVRNAALKADPVFINHERIHLRQQLEMLIVPFYIWYVLEYGIRYLQYKNGRQAYRNISFEREAYAREEDLDFLKRRSIWNFVTYLSQKSEG